MLTRWLGTLALGLLLSACGGGGESSSPTAVNSGAPSGNETSSGSGSNSGGAGTPTNPPPNPGSAPPPVFTIDETARFNEPGDIAIDAAGNLYVMDRGNEALRKISPAGEVSTLPGAYRYGGMVIDPFGNLFTRSYNPEATVEHRESYEVHKVVPDGSRELIRRIEVKPGSYPPTALATDAEGRLYIYSNYRLSHFVVERFDSASNFSTGSTVFSASMPFMPDPVAFTSDPDGSLAFAFDAYGGSFQWTMIVPQAQQPFEAQLSPIAESPLEHYLYSWVGSMTLESTGDIYMAGLTLSEDETGELRAGQPIQIRKRSPDGTITTVYSVAPDGPTEPLSGTGFYFGGVSLARAANGDFYVSDRYRHAIYRITSSGQASLIAGKPGEAGYSD